MKWSAWLVPALLTGMLAVAAHAAGPPRSKATAAAPSQKRGLPWLKLKAARQPLKARLDQLRLKPLVMVSAQQPALPPPAEAAALVTLGAQATVAPGAYALANGVGIWAAGTLPAEGVVPSIDFEWSGNFFILYSLTGTQGKDLVVECTGALSAMMTVQGYAITATEEIGSVVLTVSTTQNKTKVKALIDPADIGGAPWLLIGVSDTNENESWRLTSCTVEKK